MVPGTYTVGILFWEGGGDSYFYSVLNFGATIGI